MLDGAMRYLLPPILLFILVGCGAPNIGVAQQDSHFLHNFISDVAIATKNRSPTTQESKVLYTEAVQAEPFLHDYDGKFDWLWGFYGDWKNAWFGPRGHAAFWTLVAVAAGVYILYIVAAALASSSGTGVVVKAAGWIESGLASIWSFGAKDLGSLAKKVVTKTPPPSPLS